MSEDLVPVLGVIFLFSTISAIVLVPIWLRSRENREMQQTLRMAMEKGQPLPPELIEAIRTPGRKPATAQSDLRKGMIWLAVGLGVAVFAVVLGYEEQEALHPLLGMSAIPALIGLAFIILSAFNPNKARPKA